MAANINTWRVWCVSCRSISVSAHQYSEAVFLQYVVHNTRVIPAFQSGRLYPPVVPFLQYALLQREKISHIQQMAGEQLGAGVIVS